MNEHHYTQEPDLFKWRKVSFASTWLTTFFTNGT